MASSWPVMQYASTNGDGTGTTNLIGDYSAGALVVSITAPSTKALNVQRVLVSIEDAGSFDAATYGNGLALTNGITVDLYEDDVLQVALTPKPITTNAEWATNCHDVTVHNFGIGNEVLTARWTFAKADPAGLWLDPGDSIRITLNDDLTGLIGHRFLFQGHQPR